MAAVESEIVVAIVTTPVLVLVVGHENGRCGGKKDGSSEEGASEMHLDCRLGGD